jgi:polysaccharide export outer membrane protein
LALLLFAAEACFQHSFAQDSSDHRLSPRDTVRIKVFQNTDLQVDSRVADDGTINYPLTGTVVIGGLTLAAAEKKLVQMLKLNGIDIDATQLSLALVKTPALQALGAPISDKGDYRLGPGDAIRIAVFQNPDLSLDSRISDSGTITYPLIGVVDLGGLSVIGAEQKLAKLLRDSGFVADPQLSITLIQVRGSQVSLLGLVNKPGRYPLEQARMKLTDVLALGGGVVQGAADNIVLVGMRDGKLMRKTIDVTSMILKGGPEDDITVQNGDILYVNKAPVFYIFGEVQKPGSYRIERDMTLMQALATGGGITQRGTLRGIKVYRRDEKTGKGAKIELEMQDQIRPDDVISVRESWF